MATGPHVPPVTLVHDDRILHPDGGVAGQDRAPAPGVEPARVIGVEGIDPPVEGPGRIAADVQTPASSREGDQRRPLQGLRAELLLRQHRQRLELDAGAGPGEDDGVAPPLAHRASETVGQVVRVVDHDRAGCAGPEPRALAGRLHRHDGSVDAREGGPGEPHSEECDIRPRRGWRRSRGQVGLAHLTVPRGAGPGER